jgi:hypothetical protein
MKILKLAIEVAFAWLFAVALWGCPAQSPSEEQSHSGDAGMHDEDPQNDQDDPSDPHDDGGVLEPNDPDDPNDPSDPNEPNDPDPGDPNDPDPGDPIDPETAHMFMPTDGPANTRAPELLLDAAGDLHAVYPAYAGGDAYYAFCADGCADPRELQVVLLETEGTVLNASLVVTQTGKPRILLSTALDLYWAECDGGCSDASGWQTSVILHHNGDRAISDGALALDTDDHPRFVMNTSIALLGIGQKTPETSFAQCDSDCGAASAWSVDVIQDQIWEASQLEYDSTGRAHLATVAVTLGSGGPLGRQAAYLVCETGCTSAEDWSGIGLAAAYEDFAEELHPGISLALTEAGGPRIAVIAESATGGKQLAYFECDAGCDQDNWQVALISEHDAIGSGVQIQLDAAGHPNIAFTLADSIGVYQCNGSNCIDEGAPWNLKEVEMASSLPPDDLGIFWPNCTIAGWALQDPSLVLGSGGELFVGYQAEDLTGGATTRDPTKPACLAGADMVLTRLALLR